MGHTIMFFLSATNSSDVMVATPSSYRLDHSPLLKGRNIVEGGRGGRVAGEGDDVTVFSYLFRLPVNDAYTARRRAEIWFIEGEHTTTSVSVSRGNRCQTARSVDSPQSYVEIPSISHASVVAAELQPLLPLLSVVAAAAVVGGCCCCCCCCQFNCFTFNCHRTSCN